MIPYAILPLMNIISVIPLNKPIGPDCISHKMLKSAIFTIKVKPLTSRFNKSLSDFFFYFYGNLLVTPLFKKDGL